MQAPEFVRQTIDQVRDHADHMKRSAFAAGVLVLGGMGLIAIDAGPAVAGGEHYSSTTTTTECPTTTTTVPETTTTTVPETTTTVPETTTTTVPETTTTESSTTTSTTEASTTTTTEVPSTTGETTTTTTAEGILPRTGSRSKALAGTALAALTGAGSLGAFLYGGRRRKKLSGRFQQNLPLAQIFLNNAWHLSQRIALSYLLW